MLVSEETGAVYMLRWTRSVPEVRGRFQSRYVVYTIYAFSVNRR